MSVLKVDTQSLVPKKQPYPPGAGNASEAVLRRGGPSAQAEATAWSNVDASLNMIHSVLRNQSPVVDRIAVVDSTGKVIAALGDFIFGGVPATNYFSEIHVGDPLNTGDPSQALFNANTDGSVTIGQNGWLDVLDPFDADAAWIGTQFDVFDVTGAVAGAASGTVNLIRLTVTGHTLLTGDVVQVRKVVGVTTATDGTSNANGTWTVTKIDANHVDLQNSVFVGAYVSGGTIDRLLHVTGAANNGSGLIRLTVAAHAYETGDKVDVQVVGGVPNATGQWIITVIDASHFDLDGSMFAGAYTSGGTSLRYFAGGLFQTIAIGPSFVNYNLRAFADGTLKLRNAAIIVSAVGYTVKIDPSNTTAPIEIIDNTSGTTVTSIGGVITIVDPTATNGTTIQPGSILLNVGSDVATLSALGVSGLNSFFIQGNSASITFDGFGIAISAVSGLTINTLPSVSVTRNFGTSVSIGTDGTAVRGTPGVGQSNFTAVTSVSLNTTANRFTRGILTL